MIIGDEITQSLDEESTKYVTKMIDILSRDKTILLITHNLDMATTFDRIITMEKGKIISDINKKQK
jgi:ABC-type transport system involved in cytochrome bd biosynthesis fused ATPase/permease subunit